MKIFRKSPKHFQEGYPVQLRMARCGERGRHKLDDQVFYFLLALWMNDPKANFAGCQSNIWASPQILTNLGKPSPNWPHPGKENSFSFFLCQMVTFLQKFKMINSLKYCSAMGIGGSIWQCPRNCHPMLVLRQQKNAVVKVFTYAVFRFRFYSVVDNFRKV